MNTPIDTDRKTSPIADDYNSLMVGFTISPFISAPPVLLNGKYVQLSAYNVQEIGQAVTASKNSSLILKY